MAATDAGEVLALRGDCFATGNGRRAALKPGDKVEVADEIEVGAGAKLKLLMIDGTVVSAASGSRITIAAYTVGVGGQRSVELGLATGLLRAIVTKLDRASRFEVVTAAAVAAVRGTDWFARADAGAMQVGVLRGLVDLTSGATHRTVEIPARWGARVELGKDPVPPRVWQSSEFAQATAATELP